MNVVTRRHQQGVDGIFESMGVNPQAHREGALRIEVHQQNASSVFGQSRTQVDGGCCLTDTTLLVTHRNDGGMFRAAESRRRLSKVRKRTSGRTDRVLGSLFGLPARTGYAEQRFGGSLGHVVTFLSTSRQYCSS